MQHDSAGISNNLKNETTDHADREPPSLVLDAEPKLHDQKQAAKGTCSHGAVVSALERTRVWHFGCKFEKMRVKL
jgi:hypothetical protein